jgi:hypothetical protein
MKGDFTRDTFDPARHFSRVLMQQGRVQLDADFNEQAAILLRYLRVLATDLLGPHAGPDSGALGFEIVTKGSPINLAAIEPDETRRGVLQAALNKGDLVIGPGRYYVRGVLVENARARLFSEQAGYPFGADPIETLTKRTDALLIYLDVWERHVTYVDDDRIREAALGGPDTCSRAQVVWQVRALPAPKDGGKIDCNAVSGWTATGDGRLRARARRDKPATDLCVISPDARYRGAENQLYRVEVHAGGQVGAAGQTPSFTWSRDNGTVIFPLRSVAGTTVSVEHLGRDQRSTLSHGDWVELVDDGIVYREAPGPLARVEDVDRDELTVTLSLPQGAPPLPAFTEEEAAARHAILRRWDHAGDPKANGGALAIVEFESTPAGLEQGWIELEDGVQIWFRKSATGRTYRTGDYWLIPARVATGDVEWPDAVDSAGAPVLDDDGNPIGAPLPPHGPAHWFAPLRLLPRIVGGADPGTTDCRCRIKRLPCVDYRYAFAGAGIGGNNL